MASITCGNCKQTHASVQEVRDCYGRAALISQPGSLGQRMGMEPSRSQPHPLSPPISQMATERPETVGEGFYKLGDTIFKVQKNLAGTRLYAKSLDPNDGRWEYAPGILSGLSPKDQLTKEEAAQFGHLYGRCCICGRTLTNEDSIDAGIGPICAGKVWG